MELRDRTPPPPLRLHTVIMRTMDKNPHLRERCTFFLEKSPCWNYSKESPHAQIWGNRCSAPTPDLNHVGFHGIFAALLQNRAPHVLIEPFKMHQPVLKTEEARPRCLVHPLLGRRGQEGLDGAKFTHQGEFHRRVEDAHPQH